MSERSVEKNARVCVECGIQTYRWVHGWDGKYRCVDDAALGPLPERLSANHCPTCRCSPPALAAALAEGGGERG